jgi:TP901 family phage tail tape measure protein
MNNDSLSLLILAMLNEEKSIQTIEKQIENIRKTIQKNPILLKVQFDTSGLDSFKEKFDKLKSKSESMSGGEREGASLINVPELSDASNTMETIIQKAKRIREHFEKLGKDVTISQVMDDSGLEVDKFQVKVSNMNGKLKETSKFLVEAGEDGYSFKKISLESTKAAETIKKASEKKASAIKKEATEIDNLILRYKAKLITEDQFRESANNMIRTSEFRNSSLQQQSKLVQALEQAESKLTRTDAESYKIRRKMYEDEQKQIEKLLLFKQKMLGGGGIKGEIEIYSDKNPKFKEALIDIRQQVESLNNTTPDLDKKIRSISAGFSNLKTEASQAGNVMTKALENAFKFMRFYIVGGLLVGTIRQVRDAFGLVKEIDEGLTQLRKVSGETIERMNDFSFVANRIAIDMGKTTKEVINASVEFARLGYSIEQAGRLAQESILFSTVGNMSVEKATTSLISTIKAFGIQVDEQGKNVRRIINEINLVGNKFAISQEDIGEILTRSSAAMKAAGNTLGETIALGTASQEIVQDASVVGTALKTMSMRIRGVSEDGEDLAELVPKLEEKFKSIGLTLKKDENTFKSTYEIMKDLASVWDQLTDMKQAEILELVAGKRQGQVVSAMISNFKQAELALETTKNSMGSAAEEMERAMDSIGFKSNKLSQTMVLMWQKSIDRQGIKRLLDAFIGLANALVWVVDKIGLLTPVLIGLTIIMVRSKFSLASFTAAMSANALHAQATGASLSTFKNTLMVLGSAFDVAKLKALAFQIGMTALYATITLGVSFGIHLLINLFSKLANAKEEAKRKAEELTQTMKRQREEMSNLSELIAQYEESAKKVGENADAKIELISIQHQISKAFEESGKQIKLETDNIEGNIEAIKKLKAEKIEDFVIENFARIGKIRESMIKSKSFENFILDEVSNDSGIFYPSNFLSTYSPEGKNIIDPYSFIYDMLSDRTKQTHNLKTFDDLKKLSNTNEEFVKILKEIIMYQQQIKDTNSYVGDDNVNVVIEAYKKLKVEIENNNTEIRMFDEYNKTLVKNNLDGITKLNDSQKKLFEDYSTLLTFDSDNTKGYTSSLQDLVNIIDEYGNKPEELKSKLKDWSDSNKVVVKTNNELKESTKSLSEIMKEAIDGVEKNEKKIKLLNSAISELNKGNSLSAETIFGLVKEYPDLIKNIEKTSDGYTIQVDILKEKIDVTKNSEIVAINAEIRIKNQVLQSTNERINIHNKEIETIADVMKARDLSAKQMDSFVADPTKANPYESYYDAKKNQVLLDEIEILLKKRELIKDIYDEMGKTKDKASSSKEPSPISVKDMTKDYIDAYNNVTKLTERQAKSIERQRDLAKQEKDYTQAVKLTNDLIDKRATKIDELKVANQKMHQDANRLREEFSSKYGIAGTESWFDPLGGVTQTYIDLIKSFDGKTDDASKKRKSNIEQLFNALQQLKQAYISNNDEIIVQNDLINKEKQSIKELTEEIDKLLKKDLDNLESALTKAVRKKIEAERDSEIDKINSLIKKEEDRHKLQLKAIEDEATAKQKMYQDELDALDKIKNEKDFDKNVSKQQKEIRDIQNRINALLLADDGKSKVKRLELEKELREKQEKLTETYDERNFNQKKEHIKSLADKDKEFYDSKKEQEKDFSEKEKNSLKEQLETTKTFYQDQLSEAKLYQETRKIMIMNSYEEIAEMIVDYTTKYEKGFSEWGDTVDGVILKIKQLQTVLKDETKMVRGVLENLGFEISHDGTNVLISKDGRTDTLFMDKFSLGADGYNYGKMSDIYQGIRNAGFAEGGINSIPGLYPLHGTTSRPEAVLNYSQLNNLFKLLNNPFGLDLSSNIPKVSNSNQGNASVQIGSLVTVNGNVSDDNLNKIEQAVQKAVNKITEKFTNSGLGVRFSYGTRF